MLTVLLNVTPVFSQKVNPSTSTGSIVKGASKGKQIIGYLPNWAAYRRKRLVNPETINYSKYTIINYSFFYPDENGIVKSCDDYADRFLLRTDSNVVQKVHARGVKVMISMGGWTLSHNFSKIAADST